MSVFEIIVIAVGLVAGYGLVSFILGRRRGTSPSQPGPFDEPSGHDDSPPDAAPAWHDVLDVSPSASVDEIRAAYRQLMSQYHPDKVATLGSELKALAEHKSKQINLAYRESMRARGFEA